MKNKNPFGLFIHIMPALAIIVLGFTRCSEEQNNHTVTPAKTRKHDSLAFGDTKFLSNGLEGKMYFIPAGSRSIPVFDTMQVVDTVYADSINVPERRWSSGFPGLPNRFEWFGIEYKGNFQVLKEGHYTFRLISDDGSKLYIDDSLVINNDGLHGVLSKTGELDLDGSDHRIKLQYIQGPRWSIALQLVASLDHSGEQAFPGKYFRLTELHPGNQGHTRIYIITFSFLVVALMVIAYRVTRKKSKLS